jgi:hypothetical protein
VPAKLLALTNLSARLEPRSDLPHSTTQIPTVLPRWCLFAGVIQTAGLTEITKSKVLPHTRMTGPILDCFSSLHPVGAFFTPALSPLLTEIIEQSVYYPHLLVKVLCCAQQTGVHEMVVEVLLVIYLFYLGSELILTDKRKPFWSSTCLVRYYSWSLFSCASLRLVHTSCGGPEFSLSSSVLALESPPPFHHPSSRDAPSPGDQLLLTRWARHGFTRPGEGPGPYSCQAVLPNPPPLEF